MQTVVTRKIEFDAGHRIPNHDSKCRHIHGHRYVLEATVEGSLVMQSGASDEGMVVDFGALKEIMMDEVHAEFDHAFLVWDGDVALIDMLSELDTEHRTVVLPFIPTAENLAYVCHYRIREGLKKHSRGQGMRLRSVRIYETPNCWADYHEK